MLQKDQVDQREAKTNGTQNVHKMGRKTNKQQNQDREAWIRKLPHITWMQRQSQQSKRGMQNDDKAIRNQSDDMQN